jgi:hypothetical protein
MPVRIVPVTPTEWRSSGRGVEVTRTVPAGCWGHEWERSDRRPDDP